MIQPWLRQYNYIQDYFTTVYELYAPLYPAYPVDYYSLDFNNSIMEHNGLHAGTYEKYGVGQLSGAVWKKINLLPVHVIEQIIPSIDSGEQGMTSHESMPSQIVFTSLYGIVPVEWDVVDLSFGFKTKAINIRPLFNITQVNLAHQGDFYQIYQCRLQVAPFDRNEIETQISSHWKFDNHEKRVFPIETSNFLLNMQSRTEELSIRLKGLFNNKMGFYTRSV